MQFQQLLSYTAVGLLLPWTSVVTAQGVLDAIPQCYQDCIKQSGDFTCNGLDIPCWSRPIILSDGEIGILVYCCEDSRLTLSSFRQVYVDYPMATSSPTSLPASGEIATTILTPAR